MTMMTANTMPTAPPMSVSRAGLAMISLIVIVYVNKHRWQSLNKAKSIIFVDLWIGNSHENFFLTAYKTFVGKVILQVIVVVTVNVISLFTWQWWTGLLCRIWLGRWADWCPRSYPPWPQPRMSPRGSAPSTQPGKHSLDWFGENI